MNFILKAVYATDAGPYIKPRLVKIELVQ